MRADLIALAERVEAATTPDLRLEANVLFALYDDNLPDKYRTLSFSPTTSLDAVLALCAEKLPGVTWEVHAHGDRSFGRVGGHWNGAGAYTTPALALLAALLRALAHTPDPSEVEHGEGGAEVRLLDLFSGIGGFSLGLERAGFQTVAFCEVAPTCRHLLAHHWPGVPCYEDVRTLDATQLVRDVGPIEAICGGFPCQDLSRTGKRAGLDGEQSGLWSHFARLIRDLRPTFVFVENVPELLKRGASIVLGDLAAVGYDAEWEGIPAAAVRAPHMRPRQWLVAYPAGFGDRLAQGSFQAGWEAAFDSARWLSEPDVGRVAHGVPARVERLHALGNAVVPQIPEILGRAALKAFNQQQKAA